nr:OsmC family protein [uncultured Desulfobacter sp.]
MKISGKKNGKLAFDIKHDSYTYTLDAPETIGGEGKGPSPKGLLLSGLIGCTGIDVAMILGKMRVEIQDLEITAQTELTDQQPSVFKDITLSYHITGDEKDAKKNQTGRIHVHGNLLRGLCHAGKTQPHHPQDLSKWNRDLDNLIISMTKKIF